MRNSAAIDLRWPARRSQLPKEIFHSEAIYRLELDRIFYGPAWHMLGHEAEVPKPGDFKTIQLGEAPILIVRGDEERVRVFFNSCPHRGTQLRTCARGHGKEIECPYHRWLFNNQGELLAASGSESFPRSFRKEDHGLQELRTEMLNGLIFATCRADAPALDEFLGPARDTLTKAVAGDGRLTLLGYQKVVYNSNWKECSDNEGYHAPLLHRAFRLLRWQGGKGSQAVSKYGHKMLEAELREVPDTGFLNDHSLVAFRDKRQPPRSVVVQLFPLNVIVKHLDVINMRCGFPRSPHETEIHYAYFAHQDDDETMFRHRVRQAANLLGPSGFISLEDGAVFNRVHRGASAPGIVAFQKGVRDDDGDAEAPAGEQNDEASNLVKWERYREIMGFVRD